MKLAKALVKSDCSTCTIALGLLALILLGVVLTWWCLGVLWPWLTAWQKVAAIVLIQVASR